MPLLVFAEHVDCLLSPAFHFSVSSRGAQKVLDHPIIESLGPKTCTISLPSRLCPCFPLIAVRHREEH